MQQAYRLPHNYCPINYKSHNTGCPITESPKLVLWLAAALRLAARPRFNRCHSLLRDITLIVHGMLNFSAQLISGCRSSPTVWRAVWGEMTLPGRRVAARLPPPSRSEHKQSETSSVLGSDVLVLCYNIFYFILYYNQLVNVVDTVAGWT